MSHSAAGIRTGQRFERTFKTQVGNAIDLSKTYIRDTVVLNDTGATGTVIVSLPKIGTAYAPLGKRSTFKKSSDVAQAISLVPVAPDGLSAPSTSAFPSMGGGGSANAALLPPSVANAVTLEATDMALTGSAQPNPAGGTPTTAGAWLVVQGGGASASMGVITAMGTATIGGGGFVGPIVPGPAITANTRIMITRTAAAGGAHARGLLTVSNKTPGAANVGNFTVQAIDTAAGALVPADASTFDYIVFELV